MFLLKSLYLKKRPACFARCPAERLAQRRGRTEQQRPRRARAEEASWLKAARTPHEEVRVQEGSTDPQQPFHSTHSKPQRMWAEQKSRRRHRVPAREHEKEPQRSPGSALRPLASAHTFLVQLLCSEPQHEKDEHGEKAHNTERLQESVYVKIVYSLAAALFRKRISFLIKQQQQQVLHGNLEKCERLKLRVCVDVQKA
ncbi:hypothetical protein CB1_000832010 [Camelus ferus]|nr:hypothetical protein CB1_000832010 [Camelus ferus]